MTVRSTPCDPFAGLGTVTARNGVAIEGHVTETWEKASGGSDGKTVSYMAEYSFEVDGVPYSSTHTTTSLWASGPVWVLYDAKHPGESMPVRMP